MTEEAKKEIVALQGINAVLRMFIACNQALLEVGEKGELAEKIARIVVEKGDYPMCWVGTWGGEDFTPVAYMRDRGYVRGRKTSWQEIEDGNGPTARAMRGEIPCKANMIEISPGEPWREETLSQGFQFLVSFPLVHRKEHLGVFNVYAESSESLEGEQYELLKDLAADLALALSLLRLRAIKEQLKQALEVSEEKYRLIFQCAPVGLLEFDWAVEEEKRDRVEEFLSPWVLVRANHRALAMMGVDSFRVAQETFLDIFRGDALFLLEKLFAEVLQGKGDSVEEVEIHTSVGERRCWQLGGIRILERQGEEVVVVVSLVDVTERRILREEQEQLHRDLQRVFDQVVGMASTLIEVRCPYTAGHQRRVAFLACAMGRELGMDEEALRVLLVAGMLHDVGKMGIPAEILNKPTRLSPIEWELVKTHVQLGYEVVKQVDFPSGVKEAILEHHERLDGSGYPRGLKDGQITLEGKILAIADVVEAMSSHRPYRPSLGIEEALREIEREKSHLYEARLVELCLTLFREKGFCFPD